MNKKKTEEDWVLESKEIVEILKDLKNPDNPVYKSAIYKKALRPWTKKKKNGDLVASIMGMRLIGRYEYLMEQKKKEDLK